MMMELQRKKEYRHKSTLKQLWNKHHELLLEEQSDKSKQKMK
jgi:hypothetical protein